MALMMITSDPVASPFTCDEARWQAVMRRDRAADGAFVFSVRTTGVYCRPSCPSRRARRENVAFHAGCAEAEAAGFRPCKRCRPDGEATRQRHAAAVTAACRAIEAAPERPTLEELAAAAGMSRYHFHRIFKAVTGVTPADYASAGRRARVHDYLPRSNTITEAFHRAGFNSSGRFYERAGELLGMMPGTYRAGGKGMRIRFALGECDLGAILVAATDRGLCAISLGDDPQSLVRDLQDRFPRADLTGDDQAFAQWMATVVGFVAMPVRGLDLPLDIRGTAFQQRVWQALCEIPPGTTASYAEIAERIGKSGSARAVATACAANPLAVAIPCHRVVRTDGGLSGYRWGVARKSALLERESGGSSSSDLRTAQ